MNEEDIPTFEELLQRCLGRVSNSIDKRQGSIIYNALAPCCVELAQMYIDLYGIYNLVFIDTSVGEALDRLVQQNGLIRKAATKALRKGEFNIVVPVNSRFSDGVNSYIVKENIVDTTNSILECETAGVVGNSFYGALTPISYIVGLTTAELADILTAGTDIESDEELRTRYLDEVRGPQFGGNVSDYKNKTKELAGVGGCKVIPIWDGAGTVKLIITNSNNAAPSSELVDEIQEIICPLEASDGLGIAPIGHSVTVEGAAYLNIAVAIEVVLKNGITIPDIQDAVNDAVDNYFLSLAETWDSEENLIVRISQIETQILEINDILDISNVTLNTGVVNLSLLANQIPKRNGAVSISE